MEQLLTYFLTTTSNLSATNPQLLDLVADIQQTKGKIQDIVRGKMYCTCPVKTTTTCLQQTEIDKLEKVLKDGFHKRRDLL